MNSLRDLLVKTADDELIFGHRNSEWTGIGPTLEEDIAFSSMSQDKVGHALALYTILHEQMGEADPDTFGFTRDEADFKSCHLVELPNEEFDFSLVRQFLFDHSEWLRWQSFSNAPFEQLSNLAKKINGELKYHIMHANSWMRNLGKGNEESHARMQQALNFAFPYALGIFEPMEGEQELIDEKIYVGEQKLKEDWLTNIEKVIKESSLEMPSDTTTEAHFGGRKGYHTEHLQPMLLEMTEVFRLDPEAEW